jgi:hypothetical protein
MTSAPIPVEQFGNWLGELVSAMQNPDGQTSALSSPVPGSPALSSPGPGSSEPGSNDSRSSPFQPNVGNFMHTIAQGFHGSANDSSRGRTQDSAQPLDHVHTSHAARAAAQLRNQIIHNLGSA